LVLACRARAVFTFIFLGERKFAIVKHDARLDLVLVLGETILLQAFAWEEYSFHSQSFGKKLVGIEQVRSFWISWGPCD